MNPQMSLPSWQGQWARSGTPALLEMSRVPSRSETEQQAHFGLDRETSFSPRMGFFFPLQDNGWLPIRRLKPQQGEHARISDWRASPH